MWFKISLNDGLSDCTIDSGPTIQQDRSAKPIVKYTAPSVDLCNATANRGFRKLFKSVADVLDNKKGRASDDEMIRRIGHTNQSKLTRPPSIHSAVPDLAETMDRNPRAGY
ncbi:hypothetical protein EYR40_001251 [Pleurotus pulmonarius]|nr:hypothetical protein EYR38_004490 [Pleurotus pulmonarius]KAF4608898.1 hypothetical protein EYR40_001251 [Pleurotus pulmonarius]